MSRLLTRWHPLPLLLLASSLFVAQARAAEPFYENLLVEGSSALERGLYSNAEEALRVACFGLLEEPPSLANCLVKLGLAQAAQGDGAGLTGTLERLALIEERFGAYRNADITEAHRQAFETELARLVPRSELARVPLFAERAQNAAVERIAAMPVKKRRRAIEGLLAQNPADPQALTLLVDLELDQGRERRAVEAADALVAAAPANPASYCIRGRALAADSRCSEAVSQLDRCVRAEMAPGLARTYLDCLARLERWEAADELLQSLSAETRSAPALGQLADQIASALEPPPQQTLSEVLVTSTEIDAGSGEPTMPTMTADSVAQGPSPEAVAELERLRSKIEGVKTRPDLDELYIQVADFADLHPAFAEAQFVAGRVAYLGKRWDEATEFFARGGRPAPEQAELLFYMAVSNYEAGENELARELLELALPRLERTAFVRGYIDRILAADSTASSPG